MLRLVIFLLFLVASVWLGLEVVQHPGYLLMVYKPWIVQMPIWFALISLIIIFLVFYVLIDSFDRIEFVWYRLKNWLRIRREHKSNSKTQHGLSLLIEGRWKKAENLLLAGVNQSVEPLMNYLGAAKAAQEQSAFERRDQYIQKAYQVAPGADLAIGLTQAELELDQDQLEQAQATLVRLRQLSPKHPRVLTLLEKVYVRLADWPHLLELLPSLRKTNVLTPEQAVIFEKNIYSEIFHAANKKTLTEIRQIWHDMPKTMKNNSEVIYAYSLELLRFPDTANEVQELIRKTLKYQYDPMLAKLYGKVLFSNLNRANLNRYLVIVGAWLKLYGQKPELLLILGKLCAALQLWGKAKDYFERCLMQGPNAEASIEYGRLLEQLGETDEAMRIYREGLMQLAEVDSKKEGPFHRMRNVESAT